MSDVCSSAARLRSCGRSPHGLRRSVGAAQELEKCVLLLLVGLCCGRQSDPCCPGDPSPPILRLRVRRGCWSPMMTVIRHRPSRCVGFCPIDVDTCGLCLENGVIPFCQRPEEVTDEAKLPSGGCCRAVSSVCGGVGARKQGEWPCVWVSDALPREEMGQLPLTRRRAVPARLAQGPRRRWGPASGSAGWRPSLWPLLNRPLFALSLWTTFHPTPARTPSTWCLGSR